MSDLIRRARKARTRIDDPSLPKWQRLLQGLDAFLGLVLTGVPADTREQLEADLVDVAQLLARYSLQSDSSYESISDVDLERMLGIVDTAASCAIAAELDRIVADLDAGIEKLPVDAIREVREHRDLMAPRLIEVLKNAVSAARGGNVPEGNSHFFAIFLPTELQAESALPVSSLAYSPAFAIALDRTPRVNGVQRNPRRSIPPPHRTQRALLLRERQEV